MNKKLYKYSLVAYSESMGATIQEKIEELKKYDLKEYAYILHNKDFDENGELKKEHYHVYIKFSKQIRSETILKIFNTSVFEEVKDINALMRYFLHLGEENKHEYSQEELIKNFDFNLNSNLSKEDKEIEELNMILEHVNSDDFKGLNELLHFCLENKIWSTYRRNYSIVKDYVRLIQNAENEARTISASQFDKLIDAIYEKTVDKKV
nr:MAG TPA: Plasmid like replication protein [Inoviridae sp.]